MSREKVKISLLLNFSPALAGVARVMEYGEKKHGRSSIAHARGNWAEPNWTDTLNGVLRHLMLFYMGEKLDKGSGESHLDHAIGRLLFLSTAEKLGLRNKDIGKSFNEEDVKKMIELLEPMDGNDVE